MSDEFDDSIERKTKILARAQGMVDSGECTSLIVVATLEGGDQEIWYAHDLGDGQTTMQAIGAMEVLKGKLVSEIFDDQVYS